LQHQATKRWNLVDDVAFARFVDRARLPDQVAKEGQRVAQERVPRLEGFDQGFLVPYGRGHRLDFAGNAGARPAVSDLLGGLQGRCGAEKAVDRANEGVVVVQETGAGSKHIPLESCVAQNHDPQRVQRPLVPRGIGGCAFDQEIGQGKERAGDGEDNRARRSHDDAEPRSSAKGRPLCSPVSVPGNCAIAFISDSRS
jgi:hypothetical protein